MDPSCTLPYGVQLNYYGSILQAGSGRMTSVHERYIRMLELNPMKPYFVGQIQYCLHGPLAYNVTASFSIGSRFPFPLKVSKSLACSVNMNLSAWFPIFAKPLHLSKVSGSRLSPCASFGHSQWPFENPSKVEIVPSLMSYTSEHIVPVSSSQLHCQSSPGRMHW